MVFHLKNKWSLKQPQNINNIYILHLRTSWFAVFFFSTEIGENLFQLHLKEFWFTKTGEDKLIVKSPYSSIHPSMDY